MYCPTPPLSLPSLLYRRTLRTRSTRARGVVTSVFASAYVMITRVRAPFVIVARLCPQVARKQRAAWRWNVIPCEFCWTRGGGNKNRYAGFIIEIFSFDNIIVASHARVVCSNDIAVSKLAIRDWLEKWFFSLFLFRFLMERFSPWPVKGNR